MRLWALFVRWFPHPHTAEDFRTCTQPMLSIALSLLGAYWRVKKKLIPHKIRSFMLFEQDKVPLKLVEIFLCIREYIWRFLFFSRAEIFVALFHHLFHGLFGCFDHQYAINTSRNMSLNMRIVSHGACSLSAERLPFLHPRRNFCGPLSSPLSWTVWMFQSPIGTPKPSDESIVTSFAGYIGIPLAIWVADGMIWK